MVNLVINRDSLDNPKWSFPLGLPINISEYLPLWYGSEIAQSCHALIIRFVLGNGIGTFVLRMKSIKSGLFTGFHMNPIRGYKDFHQQSPGLKFSSPSKFPRLNLDLRWSRFRHPIERVDFDWCVLYSTGIQWTVKYSRFPCYLKTPHLVSHTGNGL